MIGAIGGASNGVSTDFSRKLCEAISRVIYHCKKKKSYFDSILLLQFATSSASLNTVESHCLLYIPNND